MTDTQSGKPSPRRSIALIAAAVFTVAAATAGVLVYRQHTTAAPAAGCPSPTTPPTGPTSGPDQSPAGGGLTVTETGYTQLHNPDLPRSDDVSIGVVIHNSSTLTAYHTQVNLDVLDANDASITPPQGSRFLRLHIPVIEPGHDIGVGDWTQLILGDQTSPKAARIRVSLTSTVWLPPGPGLVQAIGHTTKTLLSPDVHNFSGSFHYQLATTVCTGQYLRGISVLFRDITGRLIGGSFAQASSQTTCSPNTPDVDAPLLGGVPPNHDDTQNTIYPYCDPEPPQPDSNGSNAPLN